MKKIVIYIVAAIFMFTGMSFAQQHNRGNKQKRGYTYQDEQRDVERYRKANPRQKRHYDKHHYGHGYRNKYRGHRPHPPKHYRGHWNSWNTWERYHRQHRHEYRKGHYYRDNRGSLYFSFETDEGTFAFSIGR